MCPSPGCRARYRRLGGKDNQQLFLVVLEVGKSRVEVLADLMSDEHPSPGLSTADLQLCLYLRERDCLSQCLLQGHLLHDPVISSRIPPPMVPYQE